VKSQQLPEWLDRARSKPTGRLSQIAAVATLVAVMILASRLAGRHKAMLKA